MGVNTKRLNYTKIGKSQNVYKNYPLMMMQAIVILLKPDLILHSVKVTRGTAGRDPRPLILFLVDYLSVALKLELLDFTQ